jgi:hypothetical protein
MKILFASLLSTLGPMVVAVTGCQTTTQAEVPQMSTVIGLAGNARYHDGQSESWRAVRLGNYIPQGSVIQTDDGATNAVELAIGKRMRFLATPDHPDLTEGNCLTLYEASVLKLDRVTAKIVAGKRISDTRLVLVAGGVAWVAGMSGPIDYLPSESYPHGPKLGTIRPQPDKSYYEISNSNVVVHAGHAYFSFAARRRASVLMGTVAIEFRDTGIVKDVFNFEKYDFLTGEISQFKIGSSPRPGPDYFWHHLPAAHDRETPPYEVPRRPF